MQKSRILCIIDGMSDSCFDVQQYPNLASLPKQKYLKTVPDGVEPETLPCVLHLLGKSINSQDYQAMPGLRNTLAKLNSLDLKKNIIPSAPSIMQKLPEYPEKAAVVCGTNVIQCIARHLICT